MIKKDSIQKTLFGVEWHRSKLVDFTFSFFCISHAFMSRQWRTRIQSVRRRPLLTDSSFSTQESTLYKVMAFEIFPEAVKIGKLHTYKARAIIVYELVKASLLKQKSIPETLRPLSPGSFFRRFCCCITVIDEMKCSDRKGESGVNIYNAFRE